MDDSDNEICTKQNLTASVDTDGHLSPITIKFVTGDGIQLGKQYHLKITAELDLNNDGQKEANPFVTSGNDHDLGIFKMPGSLEPEITSAAGMINNGVGNSYLYIWGHNLEYTDKVMYTITAAGTTGSTNLSATYTGSDLAANFVNRGTNSGQSEYQLRIKDELSTEGMYTISVSLFTGAKSVTTTVTYGMVNS